MYKTLPLAQVFSLNMTTLKLADHHPKQLSIRTNSMSMRNMYRRVGYIMIINRPKSLGNCNTYWKYIAEPSEQISPKPSMYMAIINTNDTITALQKYFIYLLLVLSTNILSQTNGSLPCFSHHFLYKHHFKSLI